MLREDKLNEKSIEEAIAGVYKKPIEGDGVVVALPGGSGWSIHIDETGNVEVDILVLS